MYIKWIVCNVKEDKRKEFSLAQEKWIRTAEADGFIAQTGGWNSQNKNEACIISFWESKEYLSNFMNNLHDQITDENKQAETYNKINVNYFNLLFGINQHYSLLKEAVNSTGLIGVEEFQINPGKDLLFEKIMKEVWSTGMDKSSGILGGVFSKSEENTLKYLGLTFLNLTENYKDYEMNIVAELKGRTEISGIISNTEISQIIPIASWKIIK